MGGGRFGTVLAAALLALVFLAGHGAFLLRTPHDLDGVNFVLGVRHFDLVRHQPHPPGYPLFIALGHVFRPIADVIHPASQDSDFTEGSVALAACSTLFGALASFSIILFFGAIGVPLREATAAAALTMTCPLFWFLGVRPLSDLPGLTAAFAALSLALWAVRWAEEQPAGGSAASPRWLFLSGVLTAAVGSGLRIQVGIIAIPLLAAAWVMLKRRGRAPGVMSVVAVGLAGVLAWLLPLIAAAGGLHTYMGALELQGQSDVEEAVMLAASPAPGAIARALRDSFITPWGVTWLALPVLALAVVGAVVWRAHPRRLALLAGAELGYLLFHLAFQEAAHVRYALPLVPMIAVLAVAGIGRISDRAPLYGWTAVALASLVVAVPPTIVQARTGAPVFHAIAALRTDMPRHGSERPAVAMHKAIALALRGEALPIEKLTGEDSYEWLSVAQFWKRAPDRPVWFLARRRRTDLALIDPASRTVVGRYRWPFDSTSLLSGSRPVDVDLYYFDRPGWVALRGWALTPEIRGVTARDRLAGGEDTARVQVRRRPDAAMLIVGGRYTDAGCGPTPSLLVKVDGQERRRVRLSNGPAFLVVDELPAGSLAGASPWALLDVQAERADGRSCQASVAFDQFDLPRRDVMALAYASGWHEVEHDRRSGQVWRWTSDHARVRLVHVGAPAVRLRLTGTTPRHLFGQAPVLHVAVGGRPVLTTAVDGDFAFEVLLDRELLAAAGGIVDLSVDGTFVPAERGISGDHRRLGLQMFELVARPESASAATLAN